MEELKQRKFDYIIGTYSIHHLDDKQKIAFFQELLKNLNEGGKILIGDVAFETRFKLEKCKEESGDAWDSDEIYFVIDELKNVFPNLTYDKKTYCSGVIKINRN